MKRIQGVLVPMEWDREGHILALGLAGFNEIQYRLRIGPEDIPRYLGLLHKSLEMTGTLSAADEVTTFVPDRCREIVPPEIPLPDLPSRRERRSREKKQH